MYPNLKMPAAKMDAPQYHDYQREQSERIVSAGRERVLRDALAFYANGGADGGVKAKTALEIAK